MAVATRTARPSTLGTLWSSTIGKKAVMAATGMVMLGFLVIHMYGNLKIFFGATVFDSYAAWLRTIGEPVLHRTWYLWIQRVVLAVCAVLHAVTAYQLSRRDLKARGPGYVHRPPAGPSFATRTMRWGGVILLLFLVWHILDLTTGTVNPLGEAGHPYQDIVADFRDWWSDVIYIVAMAALGLHVRHGLWSAAQTLGANGPRSGPVFKVAGWVLALVLFAGFVTVPVAVMIGAVH
ncbi:succinate dehydrogenase cytochrome b subunit [Streptacidiphilus sp. P02-A3a]|uniref:succinate dehydrogenase cytochrome b subunit n=1 Tax=Streptacidiphilus sp. P02-A3a TaxID=2704468 RepID=UPI0015FE4133|nr:succinate dehydrogenase cytochrome b subunit [Streptacidiphilus sp. P02-A3a]QMU70059.1 succinate dehydrogenase cytochrome b subunit [Streptacidiphilus sp. P02-A3a]